MPRQARIDTADALHHVMSRGINRAPIFLDDRDREEFLSRAEAAFGWAEAGCLAWAIMDNHVHFALQRGRRSLSDAFRRLNTGYAIYFNRRHRRVGAVFGGRPKMKVVDSDTYLLELIRYVHLNPVKAGMVSLGGLGRFRWTGHAALMGQASPDLLAADRVLALFADHAGTARLALSDWMAGGLQPGTSADLIARLESSIGRRRLPDEVDTRVVGDAAFTEQALTAADAWQARRVALLAQGWTPERALLRVCRALAVDEAVVRTGGRARQASNARAIASWWAVETLGVTRTDMARLTGVGVASISVAVRRGAALAERLGLVDVAALPAAEQAPSETEGLQRPTLDALLVAAASTLGLSVDAMRAPGKRPPATHARKLFCAAAIGEFGYGPSEVGRALRRHRSGVARLARQPLAAALLAELRRRLVG